MSKPKDRPETSLTSNLERNLIAYVTAASAAGVGLLATPAEAKIVYTPTHVVIKAKEMYSLDLNQDGIADFILKNTHSCNTDQCFYNFTEKGLHGNGALGTVPFSSGVPFASALPKGATIGPDGAFYGGVGRIETFYIGGGGYSSRGKWPNVKKHYLGLRFKVNGEVHFGWARLNVQVLTQPVRIIGTLTGYAYETIPNKGVIAGDRGSTTGAGPDVSSEPASLGHLALGVHGLSKWHGRRG